MHLKTITDPLPDTSFGMKLVDRLSYYGSLLITVHFRDYIRKYAVIPKINTAKIFGAS
jgi:hypothetical protein